MPSLLLGVRIWNLVLIFAQQAFFFHLSHLPSLSTLTLGGFQVLRGTSEGNTWLATGVAPSFWMRAQKPPVFELGLLLYALMLVFPTWA